MKTFGIIWPDGTKELRSILFDDDGNLRIEDSLRTREIGDNWVEPQIVPLVKIDKPEEGNWEPALVWFEDRVERQWITKE
jgi:hypothetical protein